VEGRQWEGGTFAKEKSSVPEVKVSRERGGGSGQDKSHLTYAKSGMNRKQKKTAKVFSSPEEKTEWGGGAVSGGRVNEDRGG